MAAGRIFINYRRDDSGAAAGRLYDRFVQHFDRDKVFMDVDGLAPGVDFVKTLEGQLANCSACIAVIGPHWTTIKGPDGARRLDNPADYVRIELEAALKRDIPVVPVLVDGAEMPRASDVPASLAQLLRRQAVEVSHTRCGNEADELARSVGEAIGMPVVARSTAKDVNPRTLSEKLFSFKGRMARGPYWKCLALIYAMMVAVTVGVSLAVAFMLARGDPAALQALAGPESSFYGPTEMRYLTTFISLPFMWPLIALAIKRIHDFNHGWDLYAPILALGVVATGLLLAGYDAYLGPMHALGLGFSALIGFVKGTPGDNAYGPNPLTQTAS